MPDSDTAPHLLLPQSPDDTSTPQRRPADLFLPALAGSPAALDFAVTAPTRQETLASASQIEGVAAAAYAHHKDTYLATAQTCERQGILFLPMVVETTGNWDARAFKVLRQHRARGGQPHWHGSCNNLVYAPSRGQCGGAGLSSTGGFAPSGRVGISIVCLSSPWNTMEHPCDAHSW